MVVVTARQRNRIPQGNRSDLRAFCGSCTRAHTRATSRARMVEDPKKPLSGNDAMRQAAPYLNAVSELMGGTIVGLVAGHYATKYLHTGSGVSMLLALTGIGVGFFGFIRTTVRLGKKK